jgi:hypothetical protein
VIIQLEYFHLFKNTDFPTVHEQIKWTGECNSCCQQCRSDPNFAEQWTQKKIEGKVHSQEGHKRPPNLKKVEWILSPATEDSEILGFIPGHVVYEDDSEEDEEGNIFQDYGGFLDFEVVRTVVRSVPSILTIRLFSNSREMYAVLSQSKKINM